MFCGITFIPIFVKSSTKTTMNYFSELRNIKNRIATIREEAAKLLGLPLFAAYVNKLQAEHDRLLGCVVSLNDIIDSRQ